MAICAVIEVIAIGCAVLGATDLDPLSGGSGWVGAGLLGIVLAWLLGQHVPRLIAMFAAQLEQQRKDYTSSLELAVAKFDKHIDIERERCDKRMDGLSRSIDELLEDRDLRNKSNPKPG